MSTPKKFTAYKKDPSDAWCFTVNKNVNTAYEKLAKQHGNKCIKELYYQKEHYKNGRIHIQGYVLWNEVVDFLWMKKFVATFEPTTNFSNRWHSHDNAVNYHVKSRSRVAGTTKIIKN